MSSPTPIGDLKKPSRGDPLVKPEDDTLYKE